MSQVVVEDVAADLVATLTDDSGSPATGILFNEVVVEYAKEGDVSFTTKTLVTGDWQEVGSGVYKVSFTATELDTPGSFTFKVTGSAIQQFVGIVTVTEEGNTQAPTSLQTCILTGHVLDVAGKPVQGTSVAAKVIGFPTVIDAVGVSSDLIAATTDSNGQFFLEVARLAEVQVTIPKIRFTRTLTVPNTATANLFTEVS